MTGLLIIVLLFGLLWFLMIRPQRARAQEQQRALSSVAPGDEILTVGGIYGIVQELEPDEDGGDLVVEIADGIHVRVARKAARDGCQARGRGGRRRRRGRGRDDALAEAGDLASPRPSRPTG